MPTSPPAITFGPGYSARTEWESLVLIEALQASQGLINTSIRGLAVEANYELIVVHACVSDEDPDTIEDLNELVEDMVTSMDGYIRPVPRVELLVSTGDTNPEWSGYAHRCLYLMNWREREDSASK